MVALLRKQWKEAMIQTGLVPDDEEQIVACLNQWTSLDASLIVTVGGTGLGPRDRTPEATRRVIDREAPGLSEAMRALGAAKNQFAWLSRGVSGLKDNSLIINLPGSKRGAEESLGSILSLVAHGLETAAGGQEHP